MMLGYLLARAGVDVLVLEKHADFLRDFRGDTIHPSTLDVMHELGLLGGCCCRTKVERLSVQIGDATLPVADFTHLPTRCRYIAFMPQWDFPEFHGRGNTPPPDLPGLSRMQADVEDLIETQGRITGSPPRPRLGRLDIKADLGRRRRPPFDRAAARRASLSPISARPWTCYGSAVARRATRDTMGRFEPGRVLRRMIDRRDYWQCGYVIAKGSFDAIREAGLPAFRDTAWRGSRPLPASASASCRIGSRSSC
jgi:hypothetical protein